MGLTGVSHMKARERFSAIVHGEEPDYVPVIGFPGAAGVSQSYWTPVRQRLRDTGMPESVGRVMRDGVEHEDKDSWEEYWGVATPIEWEVSLAVGITGFTSTRRIEGDYEIIQSESGAVTRQVIDNDNEYSMPEFRVYPVRDRASWEFYAERMTPSQRLPNDEFDELCKPYDRRERPLCIRMIGGYHFLRELMGPEVLSLSFFDDPELVHEMAAWHVNYCRTYVFPMIERLKPEIVALTEDVCFNHGMLLSPAHFDEFAGPLYRAVGNLVSKHSTDLFAVDSDGLITQFADLAVSYGVNGLFPCEVKAGNDLFLLRERYPQLVLCGGLEKETINEGNGDSIEAEITGKVPRLLQTGRYFPNIDHSLQPLVTFDNLCRFMTRLHEECGNPEGLYPRTRSN